MSSIEAMTSRVAKNKKLPSINMWKLEGGYGDK